MGDRLPAFDVQRRCLSLPRQLVPVALTLLDGFSLGDAPVGKEQRTLEDAQIAESGRLHPVAQRILEPLGSPSGVITAEVFKAGHTAIATTWIGKDSATLGTSPNGDRFELCPVEAALLPFHLASIVGLRAGITLDGRSTLICSSDTLSGFNKPGSPAAQRPSAAPVEVAALEKCTVARWEVRTLWSARGDYMGDRRLEVLDTGRLGYWELTELTDRGLTVLTPRSLTDVLRLIGDACRAA